MTYRRSPVTNFPSLLSVLLLKSATTSLSLFPLRHPRHSMSTAITPASDKSIYFDAPIASFTMSTPNHDPDKHITKPNGPDAAVGLAREPTIVGTNEESTALATEEPETEAVHLHPNGSEGWLPAANTEDAPPPSPSPRTAGSILRKNNAGSTHSRAASVTLSPSIGRASLNRAASIGGQSISKRSIFTNSDGRAVDGSTFINGAGTTGPNATVEADPSLHERAATADGALSTKQKSKIVKSEAKAGRRFFKIIKQEGKIERQAMDVAVKELGELQRLQKDAVKREGKAHTAHTKSLTAFQKYEAAFLAARAKYEIAQAELNVNAETLDITRTNARQATETMQEKSQEIDGLRTMFGVDEREREVKLAELSGKNIKAGWLR